MNDQIFEPQAIIIIRSNGRILDINEEALQLLEVENYEAQQISLSDIFFANTPIVDHLLKTVFDGEVYEKIVSIIDKDGAYKPIKIFAAVEKHENKDPAAIINLSKIPESEYEIIQLRERQQVLEHRALLGEVTAVFAHEVRNPLNNIGTGLQFISTLVPENEEIQETISSTLADVKRLADLMESVLTFSRTGSYVFKYTNIEEILLRLIELWKPCFIKFNILCSVKVGEKIPLIYLDTRAIEQVFTNLISNAVTAIGTQGGEIIIRVSLDVDNVSDVGKYVKVDVKDSGIGIPKRLFDRIFDPFFTTNDQGTGLGLAITKQIITAHHGKIEIQPKVGDGTKFCIYLPVHRKE